MKLTIMVGVPGSGKTTKAKLMAQQQGNTRLVSRDDIRAMLFPELVYKFTKDKEELVTRVEYDTVRTMLYTGKSVIVHDTNLKTSDRDRWKELADEFCADFEEHFVDCDINTLLKRNHTRGNKALPVSRIWEMFRSYRLRRGWIPAIQKADPNLPQCVIFDVDGTLKKIGQRSPYDFTKVRQDPANVFVQELYHMYCEKYKHVLVVSGREDDKDCRKDTIESFIDDAIFCEDKLFMRKAGDHRHDFDVKEQILLEDILPKYYPVLAVDDRDTPVGMWRMNGIPCLQVGYGDF